jgi:hypothetical protein
MEADGWGPTCPLIVSMLSRIYCNLHLLRESNINMVWLHIYGEPKFLQKKKYREEHII